MGQAVETDMAVEGMSMAVSPLLCDLASEVYHTNHMDRPGAISGFA